GIYIGKGNVIHFTPGEDEGVQLVSSSSLSKSSSNPCPNCGHRPSNNGLKSSCLACFLNGGKLHRYQYGVSDAYLSAQGRGGHCTCTKSDPPETVVRRAIFFLENGYGDYNLVINNCEDFALSCKKGL
ncbi:hypothetical protein M569_14265, partial [Genlisea aurea]